ncbi:MAG: non-canonical purine NTP pyrophosphatase [Verrucomicrobia bacterium]|nr:non-canonical purine NTP pyrophosphatase [Verrucomicrobiota bacterium]
MTRLLLATRNLHKVAEIRALLGNNFECLSLRDYPDAPDVVEDAATFEGNALKKAQRLAEWIHGAASKEQGAGSRERGTGGEVTLVLADDSGLEVDALGGAPGVLSARFAALDTGASGNSKDADNNAKLLRLLAGVPEGKRSARFRCVLALAPVFASSRLPVPRCFEGVCEGRIGFDPRGMHGFGYDPLFHPVGFEQTFAELGEDTKNRISHRAKALGKLVGWLERQPLQ